MPEQMTNQGADELSSGGGTVWGSDTLKLVLMQSTYAPSAAAIQALNFLSDLTAAGSEVSVSGYSRQTLGSKTRTQSDANNELELDAADATFTAMVVGQTFRYGAVIRDTGVAGTSPVLGLLDLASGGQPTTGGDIVIQWNSRGIFTLVT